MKLKFSTQLLNVAPDNEGIAHAPPLAPVLLEVEVEGLSWFWLSISLLVLVVVDLGLHICSFSSPYSSVDLVIVCDVVDTDVDLVEENVWDWEALVDLLGVEISLLDPPPHRIWLICLCSLLVSSVS